jgi:hypothetical protein
MRPSSDDDRGSIEQRCFVRSRNIWRAGMSLRLLSQMKRPDTRELVRRVTESRDPEAALALYDHSIVCHHKRIALLRYLDAKDLLAPLEKRHHEYAQSVAAGLTDAQIQAVTRQAIGRSRLRKTMPPKQQKQS